MSSDEVTDAYGKIAEDYAGPEPAEDDPVWRRACRDLFLAHAPGRRVLEIGCGPGTDAAALADEGCDVVATDGSEEFVSIVADRFPDVEARKLDFTAAPAVSEHSVFDGIYGHSCFIHVPPESALETLGGLHDRLVSNGLLFLALAESMVCEDHVVEDWGGLEGNDLRFFYHRPGVISHMLLEAGFRAIQIRRLRWSDDSPYETGPPADRIAELEIRPYQVLARKPY